MYMKHLGSTQEQLEDFIELLLPYKSVNSEIRKLVLYSIQSNNFFVQKLSMKVVLYVLKIPLTF